MMEKLLYVGITKRFYLFITFFAICFGGIITTKAEDDLVDLLEIGTSVVNSDEAELDRLAQLEEEDDESETSSESTVSEPEKKEESESTESTEKSETTTPEKTEQTQSEESSSVTSNEEESTSQTTTPEKTEEQEESSELTQLGEQEKKEEESESESETRSGNQEEEEAEESTSTESTESTTTTPEQSFTTTVPEETQTPTSITGTSTPTFVILMKSMFDIMSSAENLSKNAHGKVKEYLKLLDDHRNKKNKTSLTELYEGLDKRKYRMAIKRLCANMADFDKSYNILVKAKQADGQYNESWKKVKCYTEVCIQSVCLVLLFFEKSYAEYVNEPDNCKSLMKIKGHVTDFRREHGKELKLKQLLKADLEKDDLYKAYIQAKTAAAQGSN